MNQEQRHRRTKYQPIEGTRLPVCVCGGVGMYGYGEPRPSLHYKKQYLCASSSLSSLRFPPVPPLLYLSWTPSSWYLLSPHLSPLLQGKARRQERETTQAKKQEGARRAFFVFSSTFSSVDFFLIFDFLICCCFEYMSIQAYRGNHTDWFGFWGGKNKLRLLGRD